MSLRKILPIFIPFYGCSNKCIYCDQNAVSGISSDNFSQSINSQALQYDTSYKWDEIAFFGGSFSCLEKEKRYECYKLADYLGISEIRVSTRPDCIDEKILSEMSINNVKIIELGIQSMDDNVLSLNKRLYDNSAVRRVFLSIGSMFDISAQIMPGMYGDSWDKFVSTVKSIIEFHPKYARIYPTLVFKNTELCNLYTKGDYQPLSLKDAVIYSLFAYVYFTVSNIKVIRMGLHNSENILEHIQAGPFHASFGDLVISCLIMLYIETKGSIIVGKRYLSSCSGYKNIIKKYYSKNINIVDEDVRLDYYGISKVVMEEYVESDWRSTSGTINLIIERLQD